ncbi:MAG: single-stranded DNA-binding protein, partial [Desulfobacterales bacterium]|nr:single-stranded DNA-binding protein [Desulfobacterales bacterium]
MASLNKVMLIGYVGADPDVRQTSNGSAVANFSLATTEKWTDKDGKKQSQTEWHRIVAWGRLAEICGEYLSKGGQVYIEGRIRTNEWEDNEGNKRKTKEIIAQRLQLLDRSEASGSA